VIGPSVLGWVEMDQTIEVLALIGLAYLLFLAGLEMDFTQLRGRLLRLALLGWAVSLALAAAAGYVRTALSSMQVSVGKPTGVTAGR
jgi:Kef-type K+ transport system membrane component KefB